MIKRQNEYLEENKALLLKNIISLIIKICYKSISLNNATLKMKEVCNDEIVKECLKK